MNRTIAGMTLPTVLSNISVPLLGLCDTAVAGHMGEEKYLAGIAIGSVMMSGVYWLFSFLRGGTSGLTASAYGASDRGRMGQTLMRAVLMGVVIGLLLMAVSQPVRNILLGVMGASDAVSDLASYYFSVCIAGAVPMMVLTAVTGWFVGMQSTGKAMLLNVGMSMLNVAATLTFVYVFGLGFKGIAMGTLTAQWIMVLPVAVMAAGMCRRHGIRIGAGWKPVVLSGGWKLIFSVNSNLFFRSACLIAATVLLYACAARMGEVATGANAVINQMFLFFSFFMDGLAYTGEALDYKVPLLRSISAVNKAATEVCRYFDKNVEKVFSYLGWEQEYFLVDEGLYAARPDLLMTGRTLMGHDSAKNQQLEDHYFGAIPSRVAAFMKELEIEALKLLSLIHISEPTRH